MTLLQVKKGVAYDELNMADLYIFINDDDKKIRVLKKKRKKKMNNQKTKKKNKVEKKKENYKMKKWVRKM